MAQVIDAVRFKVVEGDEGNEEFVLEEHVVDIQADPNTGVITKSSVGWQEAEVDD